MNKTTTMKPAHPKFALRLSTTLCQTPGSKFPPSEFCVYTHPDTPMDKVMAKVTARLEAAGVKVLGKTSHRIVPGYGKGMAQLLAGKFNR